MPGSFTILPESRFVYTRAWGIFSAPFLFAHIEALKNHPRFDSSFAQLADLREVSDVTLDSAAVRGAVAANPFGAGSRRAMVASSDFVFGMLRMYELLRQPGRDELMVFRDLPRALQWLDTSVPAGTDFSTLPPDWLYEQD